MNAETSSLKAKTFKSLLQEELIERCRRNPRYSLRSFAKTLDVSPAALSDMLKGKRAITERSVEKFGFALGLSLKEIEKFKKQTDGASENGKVDFAQITLDQYALISDWYHYAILELIKIDDFNREIGKIAKALTITKSEANIAIERLERLGLIETKKEKINDTSNGFSTNISGNLTSQASKQLQKQILQQSIEALQHVPIELRNHTSMTMAIDPDLMPEAIERIKKFRRELNTFLESKSKPKEVYQLSISLFPISQVSKLKGEQP